MHALFLDSITDPRAMQRIAKEAGVRVADTLYGDAFRSRADRPALTSNDSP